MSDAFKDAVERYRETRGKKTRRSRKKSRRDRDSRWSSYWDGDILTLAKGEKKDSPEYLMKLAAHQRAVANFVEIQTGKRIPVTYPQRNESYTDGKTVTIGATVDEQSFDSTVGLALHEASHICWTDFDLVKELVGNPSMGTGPNPEKFMHHETFRILTDKNFPKDYIAKLLKDLLNYVEDRWIDQKAFVRTPGYRPYYTALYDRYWGSKDISKALASDEARVPKISSYMFRIINLTNPATELDALPGLAEIWKTLDLGNILRIESTRDSLRIAAQILAIVAENVEELEVVDGESQVPNNHFMPQGYPDAVEKNSSGGGEEEENDNEDSEESDSEAEGSGGSDSEEEESEENSGGSGGGDEDSDSDEDEDSDSDGSDSDEDEEDTENGSGSDDGEEDSEEDSDGEDSEEDSEGEGSEKERPSLTDREKKRLEKATQGQSDFIRGEIDKKTISEKNAKNLEVVSETGTEIVEVGDRTDGDNATDQRSMGSDDFGVGSYKAFLVKKLTESLVASEMCPMFQVGYGDGLFAGKQARVDLNAKRGVEKGLRMGRALVKKLKVRSEARVTKYNRLEKGKIDPRRIHEIGFGSDNVFFQTLTDTYTDAALHISIDASGSMGGKKWEDSMMIAAAMAYVAKKTEGLEVVIDFRATTNIYGGNVGYRTSATEASPYVLIGFDSRVDHISKVKKFFPYMGPHSATPEGLCFEAIMDYIQQSTTEQDSFFLNLSDGAPYFANYYGDAAHNHTAKMVRMFRRRGIEVLAYYIGGARDQTYGSAGYFKVMYGKSARFIDVESIGQIAKTLNELFLTKGKKQV